MLFNSEVYVFLFLPLVAWIYFAINQARLVTLGKAWLVLASLFFYGYWDVRYEALIVGSIIANYALGSVLAAPLGIRKLADPTRKLTLTFGILLNLGLLGYFKYADFFRTIVGGLLGSEWDPLNIVLPLAISFFTFQQIAYLVDCYRLEVRETDFLNYCLFVTFFPQLIAGPIVHHKEMMPQFDIARTKLANWRNIYLGCVLFGIGLFKKVVIADTFAVWANDGFGAAASLSLAESWVASLSYTLQLYFDFSGYSDMAIGAGLIFNVRLPINFFSPYKAKSIQDFWRRWHITLSTWLKEYLYIPLGGNRRGNAWTYVNLFATFLIGGLWHGAGWTFVIWGAMHGVALSIHRTWHRVGLKLPAVAGWGLTFVFVVFCWVFFRAESIGDALSISQSMLGLSDQSNGSVNGLGPYSGQMSMIALGITFGTFVCLFAPNSIELIGYRGGAALGGIIRNPGIKSFVIGCFILCADLFFLLTATSTEFLYFNF